MQNPEETSRGYEHCKWLHDKYPNVEMIPVELSDTDTFKALPKSLTMKD